MLIGKGKQLRDPQTGKIYTIMSIDRNVILHLYTKDDIINIVYKCTIDFAERNFELL